MLIIHAILLFMKYYGINIFMMRLRMQLQTTFRLEVGIYTTNFRHPVQAMEAKRLEKWHILQRSNFRLFE